jgi:hypothetical protein
LIACNRSTRESIASALGRPRVSSEAQCEHSGDRIVVWAADDKAPWPQSTGYHTRADVERSLDEVSFLSQCITPLMAVRPEGATHQWRKNPLGELSIDPVADERLVWVTTWVGAS